MWRAGLLFLSNTRYALNPTVGKTRLAEFAPPKPQSGLTEMHENQSVTARQSRDLFLIFGAADFVSNPAHVEHGLSLRQRMLPPVQKHVGAGMILALICRKEKQPTRMPTKLPFVGMLSRKKGEAYGSDTERTGGAAA